MLVNGDKIVAKKRIENVISEGEICKVVRVDENTITFAFGNGFVHKGVMTLDEYAEYFEKYVEYENDIITEVTNDLVEEIICNSEIGIKNTYNDVTINGKTMIRTDMICILPNGFEICSSYTSTDEDLNIDECRHEIFDEIFKLESYRLCCELYEKLGTDECPYDCDECPCEGCNEEEYEEDECLDTDLDCDDCYNYDCPYNTAY